MTDHRNLLELEEAARQLFRKISVSWSKFNENGMTPAQGFLLERLEIEGPLKASQIADMLCYTPGAITTLSDKLIAAGLVERERTDEDRRVVYLSITEAGRQMLGTIRLQRRANVETFFGDLADEDIQHLIRIFKEVVYKEKV
ncbi:DNA-binding transcriptional regulator, MarR family [Paenibacillus sp. 1_12]|uniref:MarR family winged helix-turn-helix transcriptional regulator n=1 Tax=Paenibacillus sp. 1_12 TaxID=1566278 RepID=UPI0008F2195C|nr:MarR family transcriptional regulator [Paenibacillus sp. 1_12]SFK67802.1 DNA-binding transcriptional regulator, MarR family [Paenibacillus sp. 1_12]